MDSKTKVITLYPEQLRVVEGRNVRTQWGDMKSLQNSIKASGIDTPLRVKKTKDKTEDGFPIFEVVKGHRRNRAMQALYKAAAMGEDAENYLLPAIEVDPKITETDITFMLLTDSDQEKLSLLEQSIGVEKLLADGVKKAEIARRMGKTATHVDDLEILIHAKGSDTYKMVQAGTMAATAAIALLRENPVQKVDEVAKKAEKEVKASGKSKVTTKHVEKAAGEPLTKGSKKKSASATNRTDAAERSGKAEKVAPKAPGGKNAEALSQLLAAEEALKAQSDMEVKPNAFETLEAIIQLLSGKKLLVELMDVFFEPEGAKKQAKKAAGKTSKTKEPEPVEEVEELDAEDEEPVEEKPAKKSAKKEPPAKKSTPAPKKSASKLPQEEEEIDEEEDLIDEDEDEDFEDVVDDDDEVDVDEDEDDDIV